MTEPTTIQIDRETWRRLNARKEPGDGFDDVVRRLLDSTEGAESAVTAPEVEEVLRDWRPGRSAEEREERREIGREVLRWLRERGSGTRLEIVDELYDQELGIEADSWWRRIARAALDHAREKGLTEYQAGSGVWTWVNKGG